MANTEKTFTAEKEANKSEMYEAQKVVDELITWERRTSLEPENNKAKTFKFTDMKVENKKGHYAYAVKV